MKQKAFLTVSGTIFGVIALLHVGRILAGWPAHVGPWEAPMWLSGVAAAVAGYLAVSAFRLRR